MPWLRADEDELPTPTEGWASQSVMHRGQLYTCVQSGSDFLWLLAGAALPVIDWYAANVEGNISTPAGNGT